MTLNCIKFLGMNSAKSVHLERKKIEYNGAPPAKVLRIAWEADGFQTNSRSTCPALAAYCLLRAGLLTCQSVSQSVPTHCMGQVEQ